MKFNLCNTFLVFLLSVIYFSCEAQRVVTSPGTCIRDADCAESSEFCDENFRCHLHLHENADCTTSHHCKKGLYCGWKDGRNACVPQLKPFQDCDIYANTPCVSTTKRTYKCYKDTHTCLHVGFIGDRCESTEDCQAGNYCDTANVRFTRDRKCAKQKPLGAPCSSQDECEDYCSYNSVPEINAGVCTLPSRIGKPCNDDTQCQGYNSAYNDPTMKGKSKVVCNIAKGYIGLCQHERDLIKKDGLTCNPNKDFCDSKRGLSCRTTPTGPRCMFNQLEGDYPNSPYCDINSKFSNCNPHIGRPTECRADDDQFAFPEAKHFFHCIYKREILPQGSLCNIVDDVVCEKGTTCMAVPGIEQERFPLSREAKFCVIVRQEGERCFSKFRFACAKRLKCKNNVCVKGTSDSTITHADLSRSCNSLPCVPGTECTLDFGRKTCNLKTVSKGEGEPCKTSLNSVVSSPTNSLSLSMNFQ